MSGRAAIMGTFVDREGGRSTSFDNAKVDCPRCEEAGGWTGYNTGLNCPFGCGVRVVSTQAEDNERWRREMDAAEAVSRERRVLRRSKRGPSVAQKDKKASDDKGAGGMTRKEGC